MNRISKCDFCHKIVEHGEKVIAIIPDVEVSNRDYNKECRLKLSVDSIESRQVRIYCSRCLNLESYLMEIEK